MGFKTKKKKTNSKKDFSNQLGMIWTRESQKGNIYHSMVLGNDKYDVYLVEKDNEEVFYNLSKRKNPPFYLNIFDNPNKEEDNHPDLHVVLRKNED